MNKKSNAVMSRAPKKNGQNEITRRIMDSKLERKQTSGET
jgi:hypothetical protein